MFPWTQIIKKWGVVQYFTFSWYCKTEKNIFCNIISTLLICNRCSYIYIFLWVYMCIVYFHRFKVYVHSAHSAIWFSGRNTKINEIVNFKLIFNFTQEPAEVTELLRGCQSPQRLFHNPILLYIKRKTSESP